MLAARLSDGWFQRQGVRNALSAQCNCARAEPTIIPTCPDAIPSLCRPAPWHAGAMRSCSAVRFRTGTREIVGHGAAFDTPSTGARHIVPEDFLDQLLAAG